jgi:MmyB-like transcription regulator ligand binding domain
MRTEAGRDPHDRGLQDPVGFRRVGADYNVRTHGAGTQRFNHPVGELTSPTRTLRSPPEPGLALPVYAPNPARRPPNASACPFLGGDHRGCEISRPDIRLLQQLHVETVVTQRLRAFGGAGCGSRLQFGRGQLADDGLLDSRAFQALPVTSIIRWTCLLIG